MFCTEVLFLCHLITCLPGWCLVLHTPVRRIQRKVHLLGATLEAWYHLTEIPGHDGEHHTLGEESAEAQRIGW